MRSSSLKKLFGLSAIVLFGISGLAGCNKTKAKVDYAAQLHLTLEYKDKDFFTQGVGEFNLFTCIDGDTAHFTPIVTTTSSKTVKARFYGVDTPESTGRVQEWGKEASNFTKEHLKNAAANGTIVLAGVSSAYGAPSTDANGRYLSCIWINEDEKNADISTLRNLNLMLIQEGFSEPGSLDKMPEYADIFEKAYWQAKEFKLNMFSGKPSPLFNYGDYEDTYIPDICMAVQAQLDDPEVENPFNGAKVRVRGTVVGYANNLLFLQKYDEVTEEYYSINIFCGMTKPSNKYLVPNTVLQLCGVAQDSEEFGFQITGVEGHFPTLESLASEDDVQILVKADKNTDEATKVKSFTYTANQLTTIVNNRNYECLNSGIKLTDNVKVNYFKANQENNKWTLGFANQEFDLYLTIAVAPDPEKPNETWTTSAQWMGKTINIANGIFTYHEYTKSSTGEKAIGFQIIITSVNDIVLIKEN